MSDYTPSCPLVWIRISIEDFFGNLKTGMRGAYKKVSAYHLQSYLNENAWRHNAKGSGPALLEQLPMKAAAQQPGDL